MCILSLDLMDKSIGFPASTQRASSSLTDRDGVMVKATGHRSRKGKGYKFGPCKSAVVQFNPVLRFTHFQRISKEQLSLSSPAKEQVVPQLESIS